MTQHEWWQSFFSGLWLEVQRQRGAEEIVKEADFLVHCLGLRSGTKVLDVPCGNGRLSLELAGRGCRVTGVDFSPSLLEEGRQEAAARGLEIDYHQRDMRDLPWEGEFDAAFCFFGSFGYFDDAGNNSFVAAVARVVRPQGRFLLDIPNLAESLLPGFDPRGWWRAGEVLVAEERSYDHERGRIDVEWTLIKGQQQEKRRSSMRAYTYRELTALLSAAGWSDFEAYSSLEAEPFSLGRRLFLVATRSTG